METSELLFEVIDKLMAAHSGFLKSDVGLRVEQCEIFGSGIAREVADITDVVRKRLIDRISAPVSMRERLLELSAFQELMSNSANFTHIPALVRTQVLAQNYICFVYLPDALFHSLREYAPADSTLHLSSRYLTSPPVRAFRNAVAHGNWSYRKNFDGIEYWSETAYGNRRYRHRIVDQAILDHWQALARSTAYCALVALKGYAH